jgi:hypothetical protein
MVFLQTDMPRLEYMNSMANLACYHQNISIFCHNNNMPSPQDPLQEYVIGYPKLAAQMEILPELSIFRRFGGLNAQNLLYMQAELTYLEKKLRERQRADSTDPSGKRSSYALNWFWLKASENTDAGGQQQMVLRIREVLKEYSKCNRV